MRANESFEKTITSEDVERWRYPRFFCEISEDKAVVTGEDAHHLLKVLRMRPGDKAVLCDQDGMDYLASLSGSDASNAYFQVLDKKPNEAEPSVYIRLFQCLPKGDKMDFIVQKAVELGVSEIVPVLSSRCVSRPDAKSALKKNERWNKIAVEAAKQCGRGKIPRVAEIISINQAFQKKSSDTLGIFFYECGGESLRIIVNETKRIDIVIGSEGGFDQHEAKMAQQYGFVTATLGNRILRCETAPIAALSVLMNLTGNI